MPLPGQAYLVGNLESRMDLEVLDLDRHLEETHAGVREGLLNLLKRKYRLGADEIDTFDVILTLQLMLGPKHDLYPNRSKDLALAEQAVCQAGELFCEEVLRQQPSTLAFSLKNGGTPIAANVGIFLSMMKGFREGRSFDLRAARNEIFHSLEHVCREFVRLILDRNPDLVAFTVYDLAVPLIARTSQLLRGEGCTVIWGGPSCDFRQSRVVFLSMGACDYLLVGEAEQSFNALVLALEQGQDPSDIPGLATLKKDGTIRYSPPVVPEITALAPPLYDHFDLCTTLPVVGSRGCGFRCAYCTSRSERMTRRTRDPEAVAREIADLCARHSSVERYYFSESLFGRDAAWIEAFCERLVQLGQVRPWRCTTRAAGLSRDILEQMHAAGCELITFGIEHFHPQMLRLMNKSVDPAEAERIVLDCCNVGITPVVNIIINFPGEQPEHFTHNMMVLNRLAQQTHYEMEAACRPFCLKFGSGVYEDAEAFGVTLTSKEEIPEALAPVVQEVLALTATWKSKNELDPARIDREMGALVHRLSKS